MWNVMNKEMRMPALAAAACAAVMLVVSPVSAAPDRDDAAAAVSDYRAYLQSDSVCKFKTMQGKAKGGAAKCVADRMSEARIAARTEKQKCIDDGGTPKSCQPVVYQYWVDLAP